MTITQAGASKRLDAFPGRIGVGDVVVREFLALQLRVQSTSEPGAGSQVAVERGLLVRVLAVAQVLQLDERERWPARGTALRRAAVAAERWTGSR